MRILPLRDMVLVEVQDSPQPKTHVIRLGNGGPMRQAVVVACGPEVRDIQERQVVLINTAAGTAIAGQLLIPEHAILGTL